MRLEYFQMIDRITLLQMAGLQMAGLDMPGLDMTGSRIVTGG